MWNQTRGFMARLRRNVAGNTIAMAAAALIPLIAAVGGAIDLSRYYMASARMQAACDAGALAARKKMGDNNFEDSDRLHGLTFFDQNFPDGMFGIESMVRNYSADSEGTVSGTASGSLPTTLMQIFGFGELDLTVTCAAEINISNTDIMFVLDVTGSMNCLPVDPTCTNNGDVEKPNSRMAGLRTAVMTFYDTVEEATSDVAQVRYGFLPYSQNINVGRLIPRAYMADSMSHQSREAQWQVNTQVTPVSFTVNSVTSRGADEFDFYWFNPNGESGVTTTTQCDTRVANSTLGFQDRYINDSLVPSSVTIVSETFSGTQRTRTITATGRFTRAIPIKWFSTTFNPRCFVDLNYYNYNAQFQATVVDNVVTQRNFTGWEYKNVTRDVSSLYATNSIVLETGNNGANQTHAWPGCIGEADTVATAALNPVPAGAFDLDINLIPNSQATRWKPQLPTATYMRRTGGADTRSTTTDHGFSTAADAIPFYTCPKAATRLADMSRTQVQNYISAANGFVATGATYHDLGILWGARMISPRGIFSANNATAPNGDAIGRHIVFMTDGTPAANLNILTTYGVEWWDRRVSGNGGGFATRDGHAARLQAVCLQARQENISVWVVAFGTALTQNLIDCATPGRAFSANDSATLDSTFRQIAQRIAALRLTQ